VFAYCGGMAHVLEKLGAFLAERAGEISNQVNGRRIFWARVTNATDVPLEVKGEPTTSHGTCTLMFRTLCPGDAGTIRFECDGEHGGAVEFALGTERLFLGLYMRASYSPLFGMDQFVLEFPGDGARALEKFYIGMPQSFMGVAGRGENCACGSAYVACVRRVNCGITTDVEVLLRHAGCAHALEDLEDLNALEHLSLAERCLAFPATGVLGSALFLAEFGAVRQGLSGMSSLDRAFVLDVLVTTFVTDGIFGARLATGALEGWRQTADHLGLQRCEAEYSVYAALAARPSQVELHAEAAHSLLRCVSLRCASELVGQVAAWKHDSTWPPAYGLQLDSSINAPTQAGAWAARQEKKLWLGPASDVLSPSSAGQARVVDPSQQQDLWGFCNNDDVMAMHLRAACSLPMGEARPPSNGGSQRVSVCGGMTPESTEAFLKALVRICVHTSAEVNIRRCRVFDAFMGVTASEKARALLGAYVRQLPLSRRCFTVPETSGWPEVSFESFSSEFFHGIDETFDPRRVLDSLGHGSGEYKNMSTNSKSGEFFFISHDKRFIVKTVSEAEACRLHGMLPAYQEHLRKNPRSMIVRYAGLYRAGLPGGVSRYFVVMASIFDPSCEVQEQFDLKGSSHNRKRKKGELTGKDEDWINHSMRVRLPPSLRREILAMHERDVSFLMRYGVMDYSLLVGIHRRNKGDVGASGRRDPGGGIWAEGGAALYISSG